MRLLTSALAFYLLCSASAVAQDADAATHSFDHVSLELTLPVGYSFNQKLEESEPGPFGLYSFVNPAVGFFSVAVHAYLQPEQRLDFLAGGWAESDLAHLGTPERVDPSYLSLSDGSAFRNTNEAEGYDVLTVYTCNGTRCYRATVTGRSAQFESEAPRYAALLGGINFR